MVKAFEAAISLGRARDRAPMEFGVRVVDVLSRSLRPVNLKYLGVAIRRRFNRTFRLGTVDYSQLGEQMVILNILDRLDKRALERVYVDIGAFHPYKGSNTYALYLRNWRGVVVEPNPAKTELFRLIRPSISASPGRSYPTPGTSRRWRCLRRGRRTPANRSPRG